MARAAPPPHLVRMADVDPPLPGSLAALEGLDIAKGAYGGPRVARVSRALRVPIEALSPGEVRFLLHEGRGIAHLMPRALAALEADPFLAADGSVGDLLVTTLVAADRAWSPDSPWRDQLARVLDAARRRLDAVSPDVRDALRDEIDLACDRFLAA